MMVRSVAAVLLIAMLAVPVAEAADARPNKQKYLVWNVGLTSVFTLFSARVQQRRRFTLGDVLKYLGIGAASGLSFYEAKRIVGADRTTEGWLLANATASVVENTASGERAFGRIGYTVGPLRLRFATPLAQQAVATVEADWSLAETGALIRGRLLGDHFRVRHGLIAIDRDTPWPTNALSGRPFYGLTNGVFPGVAPGHDAIVWPHEMVHVVQDLQFDSVEPSVHVFGGSLGGQQTRRFFAFRNLRLGFTYALNAPTFRRPYQEQWNEVEAYGLAQRMPVFR
jgi:hypothetical protein